MAIVTSAGPSIPAEVSACYTDLQKVNAFADAVVAMFDKYPAIADPDEALRCGWGDTEEDLKRAAGHWRRLALVSLRRGETYHALKQARGSGIPAGELEGVYALLFR